MAGCPTYFLVIRADCLPDFVGVSFIMFYLNMGKFPVSCHLDFGHLPVHLHGYFGLLSEACTTRKTLKLWGEWVVVLRFRTWGRLDCPGSF